MERISLGSSREGADALPEPTESSKRVKRLTGYNNELTSKLASRIAESSNFPSSKMLVKGDRMKEMAETFGKNIRTGKNSMLVAIGTIGGMGSTVALNAMGASSFGVLAPALAIPILGSIIKVFGNELNASKRYRASETLMRFDEDISSTPDKKVNAERIIKDSEDQHNEKHSYKKFLNATRFAATNPSFVMPALMRGVTKEQIPVEKLIRKYKPLPTSALMRATGASVSGMIIGASAFGIGNEILKPFSAISRDAFDFVANGKIPDDLSKHIPVMGDGINQLADMLKKIFLK